MNDFPFPKSSQPNSPKRLSYEDSKYESNGNEDRFLNLFESDSQNKAEDTQKVKLNQQVTKSIPTMNYLITQASNKTQNQCSEYNQEYKNLQISDEPQGDWFIFYLRRRFEGSLYILAKESCQNRLQKDYGIVAKKKLQVQRKKDKKEKEEIYKYMKNQYANTGDSFFNDAYEHYQYIYNDILQNYDEPYRNAKIERLKDKPKKTSYTEIYRGKKFLEQIKAQYPNELKEFIENRAFEKIRTSLMFGKQTKFQKVETLPSQEKCEQYLPLFYCLINSNDEQGMKKVKLE